MAVLVIYESYELIGHTNENLDHNLNRIGKGRIACCKLVPLQLLLKHDVA